MQVKKNKSIKSIEAIEANAKFLVVNKFLQQSLKGGAGKADIVDR